MILVTGATGFLGAELVTQLLEKGATLRCLKRAGSVIPARLAGAGIEWVEADLLDQYSLETAFEGISCVYHCAALVSFRSADRALLRQVNASGTAAIVNLCLQMNVGKLVHVSSIAAIGEAKAGELIDEKDHWEFNGSQSGYAISKYEAEMEVWRGIAEGLTAAIVNPSVIIGRHAGVQGSGAIFEAVRKGLRFYTPGSVGIVDVRDVAKAMILVMESAISGKRFILNSGNMKFGELFAAIAAGYGIPAPAFKINKFMMAIAWRAAKLLSAFTGRQFSLSRETAISSFQRHNYSNRAFLEAFPQFHFIPVKDAVSDVCKNRG